MTTVFSVLDIHACYSTVCMFMYKIIIFMHIKIIIRDCTLLSQSKQLTVGLNNNTIFNKLLTKHAFLH